MRLASIGLSVSVVETRQQRQTMLGTLKKKKNWNDKNEVLRGLKDHEIAMLVNHVTKQLNIKLAKARLPGCLIVLVSEAIVGFLKENNLKIDLFYFKIIYNKSI